MKRPENGVCPVCGAPVQENARFCLHCMTSFDNKTPVGAPEPRSKKRVLKWLVPALCVLLAGVAALVFFIAGNKAPEAAAPQTKKTAADEAALTGQTPTAEQEATTAEPPVLPTPLNTYAEFLEAAALTQDRLGCAGLWDLNGFKQVMGNSTTEFIKYTAPVNLSGARLDLFYRNDAQVVTLILSDVAEADLDGAKLLCAAVHAAAMNYYSDLPDMLKDEETYIRSDYDLPYEPFFAELVGRTERYEAQIASGARFTTRYLLIEDENETERFAVYYETKKEADGDVRYDLILRIDYFGNNEIELV